ncbi:MAG: hypothetical protein IKY96_07580 [Oscillospiraceae bacterium]|nr:hypothetical protein [Oscillospiraceae bacterium]
MINTVNLSHLEPKAREFLRGERFCGAVGMGNLLEPLSDAPRRDPPLEACHVLMTKPGRYLKEGQPFSMKPNAQWTARLSALAWKRYNGPIHLLTDEVGGRYVRQIGLDQVYDSIRDDLWDCYGLNQKKFWASGKLLALERLETPCLILDMDLIVWKPLPVRMAPLTVAHIEHLNERVYPDPEKHFLMSPRYRYPEDWDFTAEPVNTALVWFGDEALKKEYLKEAFRFMKYERDTPDDGAVCMVFAEQRILGMCAARRGISPEVLLDYDRITEPQDLLTHTWGGKRILNQLSDMEDVFVALCKEKCGQLEQELENR